ncbi:hypothetical protein JTB14_006325 [Gonioctena quinquepunctata]|nr:hypothetical protein JTB14_006325 [Gonioctena quinquepunctata]
MNAKLMVPRNFTLREGDSTPSLFHANTISECDGTEAEYRGGVDDPRMSTKYGNPAVILQRLVLPSEDKWWSFQAIKRTFVYLITEMLTYFRLPHDKTARFTKLSVCVCLS